MTANLRISPLDILEQHCDGHWDQVLDRKWCSHREVSERNEIRLLRVEVKVASNAVCVGIQSKVYLVVVPEF